MGTSTHMLGTQVLGQFTPVLCINDTKKFRLIKLAKFFILLVKGSLENHAIHVKIFVVVSLFE